MSNETNTPYRFDAAKLTPWSAIDVSVTNRLVVVIMCGSFNPIHLAHIAMYDAARDTLMRAGDGADASARDIVVGGFVSPVSDQYGKEGLLPFFQRAALCRAALSNHTSLSLDEWEGLQPTYVRTLYVLDHIQSAVQQWYEVDAVPNASQLAWIKQNPVRVVFLCGGDLFASFLQPGCWKLRLLKQLLEKYDVMVVRRAGETAGCSETLRQKGSLLQEHVEDTEPGKMTLLTLDLAAYHFAEAEIFANNISSSAIREMLGKDPAADLSGFIPTEIDFLVRAFYAGKTSQTS